jgi:hypothetical protein
VAAAVVASWRRRGQTLKLLGLGWGEFAASWRRWSVVWVLGVAVLPIPPAGLMSWHGERAGRAEASRRIAISSWI